MSHMLMLKLDDKREAIVGKLGTRFGVGTLDDGGLHKTRDCGMAKTPLCLDSGDRRTVHIFKIGEDPD